LAFHVEETAPTALPRANPQTLEQRMEIILAREMVKGTDTLMFRDGKGNPEWDPRTGK